MRVLAATAVVLLAAAASVRLAADPAAPAAPAEPAAPATARKPCDELKTEIEAKLEAKGVKGYTLEIVPTEQTNDLKEGKIVGSCDGGTKKIVYTRAK